MILFLLIYDQQHLKKNQSHDSLLSIINETFFLLRNWILQFEHDFVILNNNKISLEKEKKGTILLHHISYFTLKHTNIHQ